jgi:hypothetical protein
MSSTEAASVHLDLAGIEIGGEQRTAGVVDRQTLIDRARAQVVDSDHRSRPKLALSVRRAMRETEGRAERKKAEEALRRSEAYLVEAQRLSHTAVSAGTS